MRMVQAVAKDPLSDFRFDHEEGLGSYETNLLEKSFVKIAGLLRVGFGEAGACTMCMYMYVVVLTAHELA